MTLLSVLLLFLQSLYVHSIAARHKLFQRPTYLPAFSILLFSSLHPAFSYFNPAMLGSWAVLAAVDTMLNFHQTNYPRKHIFNAGFALSIAALILPSGVGFILLLFLSLMLLRSFNIAEWVVALLGYITPLYFAAGILFLFDKPIFSSFWKTTFLSLPGRIQSPVHTTAIIAGTLLLLLLGTAGIFRFLAKAIISSRRGWLLMTFYFLIACAIVVFFGGSVSHWMVLVPPLSLIAAFAFQIDKREQFCNFTFYFSLVLLIFCQLALNK